jgi:hypothetical protein
MTTIDECLAGLFPEPFLSGDLVEQEAQCRAAQVLHGAISLQRPAPAPRRRRPRRARLAVGALFAAAAVAIAVVLVIGGGATVRSEAAAAVLRRAAAAPLPAPPAHLPSGRFWYVEWNTVAESIVPVRGGGTVSAEVTTVQRFWIGARRWVVRDRVIGVRPLQPIRTATQRAALMENRGSSVVRGRDGSYDLPVSYARMLAAPTGTAALRLWLIDGQGRPAKPVRLALRRSDVIETIHDLLIEPLVPARLRAGLLRVAATVSDARVIRNVRDPLGRPAIAVVFTDKDPAAPRLRTELLFDPRSDALLAERQRAPSGRLLEQFAFQTSGLVRRIGARP